MILCAAMLCMSFSALVFAEDPPDYKCSHIHTEECYIRITECLYAPESAEAETDAETEPDSIDVTAAETDAETDAETTREHICSEENGCITRILACTHVHDENCGYFTSTENSHEDKNFDADGQGLTAEGFAVRAADAPVNWGGTKPVVAPTVDAAGVATWDVSNTTYRYLRIPVRVNVIGAMTIMLPYKLTDVGRIVNGELQYTPQCEVDGITEGDWNKSVDAEANTVTIETNVNSHGTIDIYYLFDCWNTVSNTPFFIDCSIVERGNENENAETYRLNGQIQTGHGLNIGEYANEWGNSNYSFDGFGGVDKSSAFVQKWNSVYETYFGLTESAFDGDNYLYDIAAFVVEPTGQQPYGISGTFTPKNGGELVGAVYMMDSTAPSKGSVPLNVAANGSFSITNEQLKNSVVSSNLTDVTDNRVYTLYFMVKYPKAGMEDTINLNASLSLTHTGVDSGTVIGPVTKDTCLYTGTKNPINRIYWASYNPTTANSRTGLTSLKKGYTAALNFSADFYCLNENRDDFNKNDPDVYRLEAIIDLTYLSQSKKMLEANDYQLTAYKISIVDAEGNWSQNSHGVPNIGWPEEGFEVPDWAKNEDIVIYGSTKLGGDTAGDWTELGRIKAADVWAKDKDRAFLYNSEQKISTDGIVRLKVVYNSHRTTALRVGYTMELKPDGANNLKSTDTDTLNLTGWFNYLAYKDDVADLKYQRYPVNDGTTWDPVDGTIVEARKYDETHPYTGYTETGGDWDNIYSLRNFAKAELGSSDDVAGMIVTQALYSSDKTIIGDPTTENPETTYARQKNVVNVSEIVYNISGVVTNGASSLEDLKARQNQDGANSPYNSIKMRYYVLLPEGLKLNEDPSDGVTWENDGSPYYHNWNYGSSKCLSASSALYNRYSPKVVRNEWLNVPTSDGRVNGWNPYSWGETVASEMYWEPDGTVTLGEGGSGQLLVFEREMRPDEVVDPNRAARYNMWAHTVYFWGRGLSFSAIPANGTGTLPAGDYTAQFWCQFLDDAGNPIKMTDFATNPDKGPAEVLGNVDTDTLLYIPITFNNSSGAAGSNGEIGVKADGTDSYTEKANVTPNDTYSYELKYEATQSRTKNVVLWCNIEDYNRGGNSSEWKGIVKGVGLNGRTDVTVYVRNNTFDVGSYLAGAEKDWLAEKYGWTKVDSPGAYDWTDVKAIAFSFGETEFIAASPEQKSASVYINMQAPKAEDLDTVPDKLEYSTYNEFVFSDEHPNQDGKPEYGRVLIGPTEVVLEVGYKFEFTKVSAENIDVPLEGARFSLYQWSGENEPDTVLIPVSGAPEGSDWKPVGNTVSGEDGTVRFYDLHEGTYRLIETAAPDGYILPGSQWQLSVALQNGLLKLDSVSTVGPAGDLPPAFALKQVTADDGTVIYEYRLPNMTNAELPFSGGRQTYWHTLLGGGMFCTAVLGAVLYYAYGERKRSRARKC